MRRSSRLEQGVRNRLVGRSGLRTDKQYMLSSTSPGERRPMGDLLQIIFSCTSNTRHIGNYWKCNFGLSVKTELSNKRMLDPYVSSPPFEIHQSSPILFLKGWRACRFHSRQMTIVTHTWFPNEDAICICSCILCQFEFEHDQKHTRSHDGSCS